MICGQLHDPLPEQQIHRQDISMTLPSLKLLLEDEIFTQLKTELVLLFCQRGRRRKSPSLWRAGVNKIPRAWQNEKGEAKCVECYIEEKGADLTKCSHACGIQTMIWGRDNQSVRFTKRKTAKCCLTQGIKSLLNPVLLHYAPLPSYLPFSFFLMVS
jgi:hypothetical protein